MGSVVTSLLLALGQFADRKVLAVLAKSLAVTLVVFAGVAWGGWNALDALLGWLGLDEGLVAGGGALRELAALLLTLLGLWLAWRIVALAVIQFFADEVVKAVEARHYPHAAAGARDLPLGEQVAAGTRAALRALLANLAALPLALMLLPTGIGAALVFWAVNAWLLGRELNDMVWLRHSHGADGAPAGRGQRFALGGVVAALLALPGVNLIAPILGAAAATHLIHRRPARAGETS